MPIRLCQPVTEPRTGADTESIMKCEWLKGSIIKKKKNWSKLSKDLCPQMSFLVQFTVVNKQTPILQVTVLFYVELEVKLVHSLK